MRTFTDNTGRTWTISINVGTIKRVRGMCNVDLTNIIHFDGDTLSQDSVLLRLSEDPVLLVDVLFVVCKNEADRLGVTDESFGMAMAGDAIECATAALLDELVDFFPGAKRTVLKKVLQVARKAEEKMHTNLEEALESLQVDAIVEALPSILPTIAEVS